ncbi:MAG: peptidylprolyl isomerase [Cyclobacteriaceae bacterium]|nr:peptidylprolyl isomerase [Cyclobacteriaceae bacterium]
MRINFNGRILVSVAILLLSWPSAARAQRVKISTSLGEIVVQLEPEKAPLTTANFLKYVEEDFYKGGSFFRTVRHDNQPDNPVKIAVIQAGAHPWKQNFLYQAITLERTSQTGLKHKDGTIAMARGEPDSAQESFFICIGDQPELDFEGMRNPDGQGFAAFGHVVAGMETVHSIHQARAEGQALMLPIMIMEIVVE